MVEIIYAVIFGAVQGLTEFLPVSSTGHLVLLEKLFNLSPEVFGLSFDIALHLGTLGALLIYFHTDISQIAKNIITRKDKLGMLLVIGTIPAVFFGVILESFIREGLRNPIIIAVNLFLFSFVFLIAEKVAKKTHTINTMSFKQSFVIGIYQAVALLPGVSRSGITISGGLFNGFNRENAGRFAFLLSIPVIILASIKDIPHLLSIDFSLNTLSIFIVGMFTSFIVGYFCIKYFLLYLKHHGFGPFIVYRILLAIVIVIYFK